MSLVRESVQGNVIGLCVRLLFHDLEGNKTFHSRLSVSAQLMGGMILKLRMEYSW